LEHTFLCLSYVQKGVQVLKLIIKAHVLTAILGWLFLVIMSGALITGEGSPIAFISMCIVGIATVITMVDILSVYYAKKQKTTILPTISAIFWGIVLVIYGINTFLPNMAWQGRVVLGSLTLFAVFKIYVSISLIQGKVQSN
jgi:uncharacterized membrane protein YuzA (DUF378 family)